MTWFLSIALAIGNVLGFFIISLSEPLTTPKAAAMAISLFSAAWSFVTPVFTTVLRTLNHSLRVHVWLVEFSFNEQLNLFQTTLSSIRDLYLPIGKELDEIRHL
jgi:hypothetical protein